jgi:GT2 family glycosyltransferase
MKVSVVIRSYNEAGRIERLLLGLTAQQFKPHEIILVDSGSTDGTVAIAQRYVDKIIHIDKAEFSFGRALNLGIAAATGDVCVFASAHVYPLYDTWLKDLTAPLRHERVVLSYGRQSGDRLTKFSEHRIFERWFPAESVFPQQNYFCNNANCAIRRSAWETQPYDETLTGLEDLAWAKIAQAAGGLIAYAAEADCAHVHEETWAQVRNRYRREARAMTKIDEHAHFSALDFVILLPANIIADLAAALARGVFLREFKSILQFRYNQMLGTFQGYNDPPEITAQLRERFYYPMRRDDQRRAEDERARHVIDYEALESEAADKKGRGRVVRFSAGEQ